MIDSAEDLAEYYFTECQDHLATIEQELLAIEKRGAVIDPDGMDRAFRAARSIKGGAAFFDLIKVGQLAYRVEGALALLRSGEIAPEPACIGVVLRANDLLDEMIQHPDASNQCEISEIMAALEALADSYPPVAKRPPAAHPSRSPGPLRILMAEDDFASRLLLQTFLSRYGVCHVAVNGREAVEAFRVALERKERYDLICMDIMMPEMDGRQAVRQIRALEEADGVASTRGSKIIMTTTVGDVKQVIQCFEALCDAYLMKPIDLAELLKQMKTYEMIP